MTLTFKYETSLHPMGFAISEFSGSFSTEDFHHLQLTKIEWEEIKEASRTTSPSDILHAIANLFAAHERMGVSHD